MERTKGKMKPNPFMLYMKSRRKELERKGRRFPGGWKEVSDLVSTDWLSLPEKEKATWKEMSNARKEDREMMVPNPLFSLSSSTFIKEEHGNQTSKESKPNKSLPKTEETIVKTLNYQNFNKFSLKDVLHDFNQEKVLNQIKTRFLSLVQDSKSLYETVLTLAHFNYYDKGDLPYTFEPAEYAFCQWNIKDGIRIFEGSLIDSGDVTKNEQDNRGGRRNEILYVPPPDYTYKAGVSYSFGDDDYKKILRVIYENTVVMTDCDGKKWNYVFTGSPHVEVVRGCLAWLMYKCDLNLNIRVFPLEPVLQEFFRCAATIRRLREQGLGKVCETPNSPLEAKLSKEDYEYIMEKGSLQNVKACVVGPNYFKTQTWDYRLSLGCKWHQQADNSGGIYFCSTMFVKKWACLALSEAVYLLNSPTGPWIKFLQGKDITPRPWKEKDAMGLEMRQRLGKDPVTIRRRFELEDKFIFPNLLNVLKTMHPDGLGFQPSDIIWPVDRDIEEDLNYCPSATVRIKDPNRILTLEKRKEKIQRDALFAKRIIHAFNDW